MTRHIYIRMVCMDYLCINIIIIYYIQKHCWPTNIVNLFPKNYLMKYFWSEISLYCYDFRSSILGGGDKILSTCIFEEFSLVDFYFQVVLCGSVRLCMPLQMRLCHFLKLTCSCWRDFFSFFFLFVLQLLKRVCKFKLYLFLGWVGDFLVCLNFTGFYCTLS